MSSKFEEICKRFDGQLDLPGTQPIPPEELQIQDIGVLIRKVNILLGGLQKIRKNIMVEGYEVAGLVAEKTIKQFEKDK